MNRKKKSDVYLLITFHYKLMRVQSNTINY